MSATALLFYGVQVGFTVCTVKESSRPLALLWIRELSTPCHALCDPIVFSANGFCVKIVLLTLLRVEPSALHCADRKQEAFRASCQIRFSAMPVEGWLFVRGAPKKCVGGICLGNGCH
jgi:hypothetical protein